MAAAREPRGNGAELDAANATRREQDRRSSMSERLARLHELCRQMTAIRGAARRR